MTLPTMTKSSLQLAKAVVKPSGGVPWKKTDAVPSAAAAPLDGVRLMIVVPVPWRLLLLLKFETRTSPGFKGPRPEICEHKSDAIGIEVAVRWDRRGDKEPGMKRLGSESADARSGTMPWPL